MILIILWIVTSMVSQIIILNTNTSEVVLNVYAVFETTKEQHRAKAFIYSQFQHCSKLCHAILSQGSNMTTIEFYDGVFVGNGRTILKCIIGKNKYIVELEIKPVQHVFKRLSYRLIKHTIGEEKLYMKKTNFDVINTHPDDIEIMINEAIRESSLEYITSTDSNVNRLRAIVNNFEAKYNSLYAKAFKSLTVIVIKDWCNVKTPEYKS